MINRTELLEKLKEIIKPYLKEESLLDTVSMQTHLINDLKINSAHLVDVVLDTETQFGIMIDDESMETMVTVEGCVNVIEEKLRENAGGK
jgi:acyl carrier protein